MSGSLFDNSGVRKYLTARERFRFARAAYRQEGEIATFCLALVFTGARISELLALPCERVDVANGSIVLETLKRRKRGIFRVLPVPPRLISMLRRVHDLNAIGSDPNRRMWKWGRTTAWKRVKAVMRDANIPERLTMPKSARHAFGVDAVQNSVSLNVVQRWLGHARIETTAIYADVLGREERALAKRTWTQLEKALC
jgi:integrase/recombinase XerD